MSKIKVIVVLFVVLGFFGTAFSQNFPGDRAGRKADNLYKKLKLTNEQYAKLYPAFLSYEQKVDALKLTKVDKKAMETSMTKLQSDVNTEIEKTFTKDQATKWGTMKDKFYKMTWKKKVRKPKTTTDTEVKKDEKKDVKKEEPKKDVKKDEKKTDTKKTDTKKEEKKTDTKKEEKKK